MYEWLFFLLAPVSPVMSNATPPQDYVGVVAAEVAYSSLLPSRVEQDNKPVIDPNCPTCKGTGRIRSGDNQGWSKCPTCQPVTSAALVKPTPAFKKAPVQSIPPQYEIENRHRLR